MTAESKRFLALEPYFGGSHRAWLEGLARHSHHRFEIRGMPPRHWKWRMRGAAMQYAMRLTEEFGAVNTPMIPWDAILTTDYLDIATFRALAPPSLASKPIYLYCHENQLLYPYRHEDERDLHFVITNITSMLAADKIAFNTAYHRDAFLHALLPFFRQLPDERPDVAGIVDAIERKSQVLHLACDFGFLPPEALDDRLRNAERERGLSPIILWNQRWEYDKNPEALMDALAALIDAGEQFRVIICGESFIEQPECLREAPKRLGDRLIHHGYAIGREDYARLLAMADVVVSTALHEFFGTAVVEALAAGCYPVLPNRLSYPELVTESLHAEHLYDDDEEDLVPALRRALAACRGHEAGPALDRTPFRAAAARFSWPQMLTSYESWLSD